MDYIKRDLEQTVLEHLDMPEMIAILGPRQSGKTTLMQQIFGTLENALFISFEDRKLLELFVEDEKTFAELYVKNNRYLGIDEFQYAKEGGKKLKYIYDHYPGTKILISGSSAPGLTIHGIKYLVGRIFVFNLYPLSFEEFLRYKNTALFATYLEKKELIAAYLFRDDEPPEISAPLLELLCEIYDEYCIYGGYPRVAISETRGEKETVLRNIYSTYFLREIKDLLSLTTDFKLSKLIKSLSITLGGMISYNSLEEVSGFDYKGLLVHLNVLEKTYICKRVSPYFTNKRTEIIKVPKVYFFDNGFRNIVIDDFRAYDLRQDIGSLNENFVFTQATYAGVEVKFWRSKSKAEVDFVMEREGKLIAIESKSSFRRRTKSLTAFRDKYSPYRTIVAYRGGLEVRGGVVYLPLVFVSALV
ncbi:MAG: ATP-binding protein [Euryarchaeota archaeon]|nr:ATP-binding protein [Euryarchaeota archaeon]